MATKQQELDRLARGEGCLGRAAPDEPIFVLRAQDILMPLMVRHWTELAVLRDLPKTKQHEALELARQAEAWQRQHFTRVKWPD